MQKFDFFVIGAGSAGVRFARMAAKMGKKVAIAEEYRAGGTCVIRGCVPKKLFVYASRFPEDFSVAESFGWTMEEPKFNWTTLRKNKDKEIKRLEDIYHKLLKDSGVTVFSERAEISSETTIKLAKSGEEIEAEKIIIATGGKPRKMMVEGTSIGMSSNDIFDLIELPDKIFIYGGGYIGVEFACILNGLGVDVTIGYRGDLPLKGFDNYLRTGLAEAMKKSGITLMPKLPLSEFSLENQKLAFEYNNKKHIFGNVMNAMGRVPYSENLGLEKAGVIVDQNDAIQVDKFSQTSCPSIYALGDVTNRHCLTPVAIEEAMCLLKTLINGEQTAPNYHNIATAVFTTPEIGTIGMTEQKAIDLGLALDIYESHFRPMKNVLSGKTTKTYMKLVVDKLSQTVLGVHMMGPDAGEIIQTVAIAMQNVPRKDQFDRTMAVHPTAAEELVTMREPVRSFQGTIAEQQKIIKDMNDYNKKVTGS